MASLGAFACNDAIVKHVMLTLPEVQAVFLRGLLAVPLVSALSAYRRELFTPAASRDRRLIAVRCVMDAANSFSFLAAIHRGPMADVAVVLAVQPLLVMLGVPALTINSRSDRSVRDVIIHAVLFFFILRVSIVDLIFFYFPKSAVRLKV